MSEFFASIHVRWSGVDLTVLMFKCPLIQRNGYDSWTNTFIALVSIICTVPTAPIDIHERGIWKWESHVYNDIKRGGLDAVSPQIWSGRTVGKMGSG